MGRKAKPEIVYPDPEQISPYPDLLDWCYLKGWSSKLTREGNCWLLELFEGTELLARGRSARAVPTCFIAVATVCGEALRKSGRLSG